MFAVQIAEHGFVVDFAAANHVWTELRTHFEDGTLTTSLMKELYSKYAKGEKDSSGRHLMTRFKQLLPKTRAVAKVSGVVEGYGRCGRAALGQVPRTFACRLQQGMSTCY